MFIKPLIVVVAVLSLSSNIAVANQKDKYIKIIESVVRQTTGCRIRRIFNIPYDVSNKIGVVTSIPIFLDAKKTRLVIKRVIRGCKRFRGGGNGRYRGSV